jgi:glycosyltransferase involved in cell wall biosynthesis
VTRILLCSSYFWPDVTGIALYAKGLADHLVQRGDQVSVITGFPHYPSWRRAPGYPRLAATEVVEGVEIHRRWHLVPQRQSAASRILYEASFLTGATALTAGHRPDVVVAMSPCLSSAVVALAGGRRYRAPVGLVFQDVVGRAASQSGIGVSASMGSIIAGLEVAVARRAAQVGFTAPGFRAPFADGGIPAERMMTLRNWLERASPDLSRTPARARLGWGESEFVCLHAGNMGRKQNLQTLIAAGAQLRDQPVRIVLAGDGNDRPHLERLAGGSPNVSFHGLQPPGAYEAMLEAADVLVVNQRASVVDMALPSKLTAYFAAGRPVVGAVAYDSETAAELRRSGAGVITAPEDPQALAAAVSALRAAPQRRAQLGDRGRRYALEHLTRRAVLAQWAQFVDETRSAG